MCVPPHSVCISIHINADHFLLCVLYAFCLHGAILSFVIKGSDLSIKHTRYFENIVQSNMHPSIFTKSLQSGFSPQKQVTYITLFVATKKDCETG